MRLEDRTTPAFTAALVGSTATFIGDAAADTLQFDMAGGLLRHNRFTAGDAGFASDFDFDSGVAGDQTLAAAADSTLSIPTLGAGDDVLVLGSTTSPASDLLATVEITTAGSELDRLVVDDSSRVTPNTYTLIGAAAVGSLTATGLQVNSAAAFGGGILLTSGSAGDTVSVVSTAAGVPTSISTSGGDDSIELADGVSLNGGTVDGGAGTDTLSYAAYTTGLRVNLGANAPGFTAALDGGQENPPQSTAATGTASLTYSVATGTFDISVAVSNLDPAAVTGYHIHRAPVGVNGPIIVDLAALFGPGALTPDGAGGFTFTATGVTLPGVNEAALLGGLTYVNFHTAAAPGGLIRGQLFPTAAFVDVPGVATGTGGVSNIENATGGSAADSLVGSNLPNVLSGLDGADTLVGAKGNDAVSGGAANDVLVWSNGDNSDVMDGGAGTDLVQVNGAVAAGDVFVVAPNGPRVLFQRTNLVPFALDIGTVETLTVNGIGGDDQMTAKSLAGVADLTQLNLNGFDGNDTFTVQPSPTVAVRANGYGPVSPANPGDTFVFDAQNKAFAFVSGADASSGKYNSAGGQPVILSSIETRSEVNVGSLTAVLDGAGNLVIADALGNTNRLTVRVLGPNLVVSDNVEQFQAAPAGGTLSSDARTLTLPLAAVTGQLVIRLGAGADTLIVDETTPLPLATVYDGGDPTGVEGDQLILTGGTFAGVTHTFVDGSSGVITFGGAAGSIAYSGLEPVDMTGTTINDLVFNLPAAGSVASLEDDGVAGNGVSQIRSAGGTFETTTFADPTGSLTINAGDPNDVLLVTDLPDLTAALTLGSTAARFLAVDFGGVITLANRQLAVTTTLLTLSGGATVSTGGGNAVLTADRTGLETGTLNAGAGTITIRPLTAGNVIDLGGPDTAGVLGLSGAELDQLVAAAVVIGDMATGDITVSAPVAPTGTFQFELVTGGAVINALGGAGVALAVSRLALTAGTGVGSFAAPLTVDVNSLEGTTATGNFVLRDTDDLTIGGVTMALNGVSAPLNVELTAGAGFVLTVSEGVTSTGADVNLTADDVVATAAVTAPSANGAVRLLTVTPGRTIDVGTNSPGSLGVTAAELLLLNAGRLVRIGGTGSGNLTVTSPVAASVGLPALVFATDANISQNAGATVTAAGFAVDLFQPATTATLTEANQVTAFAGRASVDPLGVLPPGDINFVNAGTLTIGAVPAIAGLIGGNVSVSTRAGNLTLAASAVTTGTLQLGVATAGGGGTATIPGGLLNAAGGAFITGGSGSDTFNVSGSPTTVITVNGKAPSAPTLPGDVLNYTATGAGLAITPNPTGAGLTEPGLQTLTFTDIESFNLLGPTGPVTVEGSATAADFVKLFRDASDTFTYFQYSADNGNTFGQKFRVTWSPFVFNGNGGTTVVAGKAKVDTLRVSYTGGDPLTAISGVTFNAVPADGGLLSVQGKAAVAPKDAYYLPSTTTTGDGTVTLYDSGTKNNARAITFSGLSPVDLFGLPLVVITLPNADDKLAVATGFDFATATKPALVVSGTSGGVGIESVAVWANTTVRIDTAAAPGTDGNDTVTIDAADNNYLNTNLEVATGAGTDLVTVGVTGSVVAVGKVSVQSVDIAVNKDMTAMTGTVTLNNSGTLTLGTVTVSGFTGVTQTGGGPVTLAGDATLKSDTGNVSVGSAVDSAVAGANTLTVTATAGTATLADSVGAAKQPLGLAVTGAAINLGGQKYQTTGDQTYAGPVRVGKDTTFAVTNPFPAGVFFDSTLDSAAPRGSFGVTVNTPGGGVTQFNGAVGGATDGALKFLTTDAKGTTQVNGGLVSTTGNQTFNDPVSAPGDVTFQTVVPATGVVPGTGNISFLDTGPASLKAAGVITICTAGVATFEGTVTAAGLVLDCVGGRIDLNGGLIDTGTGPQSFASDVELTEDTTLVAGTVTFVGKVNSQAGTNYTLTVNADVTFGDGVGDDQVGGVVPLGRLTVSGTTRVAGGLVRTTPRAAPATDGGQTYTGAVTVADNTRFESAGGPITFNTTLDSVPAGFDVTVTTGGLTDFRGELGGKGALGSLTTDGGGVTRVASVLVRTVGTTSSSGNQLFRDSVRVAGAKADFTVSGTEGTRSVTFDSTLNAEAGNAPQVTVTAAGDTTFAGAVGKIDPLGSLSVPGVDTLPSRGGKTFVNGKDVVTTASQQYGQRVVLGNDTTFTAGIEVRFDGQLDAATIGGQSATVTAANLTRFGGAVGADAALASLTTDLPGSVEFAAGLVQTTGGQTYLDPATVTADTAFRAGGDVLFGGTLDGPNVALVVTPATASFAKSVGQDTPLRILQVAGGTIVVGGEKMTAAERITFDGPVAVAGNATFTVLGQPGSVDFNGTLSAPGAVVVNAPGTTGFVGAVNVGSLTTDAPGLTAILTPTVTASGAINFGDPVLSAVSKAPSELTVTGGSVRFRQTLTGSNDSVTVVSGGVTRFDGDVFVRSLTTDAPGTTQVNAASVKSNGGSLNFGDPVAVGTDVTFDANGADAGVTFGQTLTGPFAVTVESPADTVFNGGVDVGSLTTDADGITRVNGGLVQTSRFQRYGDAVVVGKLDATFRNTTVGPIVFGRTLDGTKAVTVRNPGESEFVGSVGVSEPLASLTLDGGITRVTGRVLKTTGGVQQVSGIVVADVLDLQGGGVTEIDAAGNQIGQFTATLTDGSVRLSDADALALAPAGVTLTGNGFVRIRTGGDFTASASSRVTIPGGQFVIYPGLNATDANTPLTPVTTVEFSAPSTARQIVLGRPTDAVDLPAVATPVVELPAEPVSPTAAGFQNDANVGRDTFRVTPSAATPVFVYGNRPRAVPGDTLVPGFAGRAVTDFRFDGKDGLYLLADGASLRFSSIEGLSGLSQSAFVAQTGEPRDKTGVNSQQYGLRVSISQNGTVLPGGLNGARLPENPFVVSPALVNPAASTQPPRVAFGDFNGDNVPDLVLANGPGTPPLVTVIDGLALNQQIGANGELLFDVAANGVRTPRLNRIEELTTLITANGPAILAQFYAYDPGFQGGVNVAVGKLRGPNGPTTITVGADEGGGPHVRTFELVPADPQSKLPTPLVPRQLATSFGNFYAYEPSFTGGVRVAVADVTGDGADDLILAAGAGGGPRVRVFDGATTGTGTVELSGFTPAYADFFTVEPTFRGGLYLAAGNYRPDVPAEYGVQANGQPARRRADIIVGAAGGGGPRVMIFDGRGAGGLSIAGTTAPPVLANFFAFTPAELNDPLFGAANFFTGVGGVSFGSRQTENGFLSVLVSTGRGPQLRVRQFPGGLGDLAQQAVPTNPALDLTDPNLDTTLVSLGRQPLLIPRLADGNQLPLDPDDLNYGATVGGFVDPST